MLGGAQTLGAGNNCVANERATSFVSQLPPGDDQVQVSYQAGNSGTWVVNDPVANLAIAPPPPLPPVDPFQDPCMVQWTYFCGFQG